MPRRRRPRSSLRDWLEASTPYEARLLIGRKAGLGPADGRGDCSAGEHARRFTVDQVSRAFIAARRRQPGVCPGSTTIKAKGWWDTGREPSTVLISSFTPCGAEQTSEQFETNVLRATERLAEKLCQRCVYLQFTDGGTGRTKFYKVSGRDAKVYCQG